MTNDYVSCVHIQTPVAEKRIEFGCYLELLADGSMACRRGLKGRKKAKKGNWKSGTDGMAILNASSLLSPLSSTCGAILSHLCESTSLVCIHTYDFYHFIILRLRSIFKRDVTSHLKIIGNLSLGSLLFGEATRPCMPRNP